MIDDVLIGREGAMGVVTLNRPKALNALSEAMIAAIYAALIDWRDDDTIKAVLFEGNGPRAFCAGGDVRATRLGIIEGNAEEALGFYEREYRNNLLIATYPKPIVVIGHGFVMGGGIGLAGHAGIRIAVEGAKYAMPESAIGLFCDVGVNARLGGVPAHRALLFEFAGLPVDPADAIALDLADRLVPAAALADLRASLVTGATGGWEVLEEIAALFAVSPGEAAFCATADRLKPAFEHDSAARMIRAIADLAAPEESTLVETLRKRCPTSLEAILQTFRLAAADSDVARVLRRDLALARYLSMRPDFAEGVRAVLVDKDNLATWEPAESDAVDRAAIAAILCFGLTAERSGFSQLCMLTHAIKPSSIEPKLALS